MPRKKKEPDSPMQVLLANRGNPDFDQDPDDPLWGRPRDRWEAVADHAAASQLCLDYIRAHDLGGGNWAGGEIRDTTTRAVVAYVSYNGCVWAGARAAYFDKAGGNTPVFVPTLEMVRGSPPGPPPPPARPLPRCDDHTIDPAAVHRCGGGYPIEFAVSCKVCGCTGNLVIESADVDWHD